MGEQAGEFDTAVVKTLRTQLSQIVASYTLKQSNTDMQEYQYLSPILKQSTTTKATDFPKTRQRERSYAISAKRFEPEKNETKQQRTDARSLSRGKEKNLSQEFEFEKQMLLQLKMRETMQKKIAEETFFGFNEAVLAEDFPAKHKLTA